MSQNPISGIFWGRPIPIESWVNGNEKQSLQSLPIKIFMVIYDCCQTNESIVVQENMKSNVCDFSLFKKCSFFNVLRESIASRDSREFVEWQWETKSVYFSINLGYM